MPSELKLDKEHVETEMILDLAELLAGFAVLDALDQCSQIYNYNVIELDKDPEGSLSEYTQF